MGATKAIPASPAPRIFDSCGRDEHRTAQEPQSKSNPELAGQDEAIRRLKRAKPDKRRPEKGLPSFKDDAPLDRLSDDEARRLQKGTVRCFWTHSADSGLLVCVARSRTSSSCNSGLRRLKTL